MPGTLWKRHVRDLHCEVDVIGHQTERMDLMSKAIRALSKKLEESLAILILEKQRLPVVAACNNLGDRAREVDSRLASHIFWDVARPLVLSACCPREFECVR